MLHSALSSSFFVYAKRRKGPIFASGNKPQCIPMLLENINKQNRRFFWAWLSPWSSAGQNPPPGCTFYLHRNLRSLDRRRVCFRADQRKIIIKKAQHQQDRILHCTSSQSLVDSNLTVAERPIGQYGKGRLRKGGGPSSSRKRHLRSADDRGSEKEAGGQWRQTATPIISCSGWARQQRQTSTCRLQPAARLLPRCPSALWEGSAAGSSDPVEMRKERTV